MNHMWLSQQNLWGNILVLSIQWAIVINHIKTIIKLILTYMGFIEKATII